MRISEICIKRPVFATVLSLVVMLIGIVSYTRLPVREYPKIDEPVVTVDTTYRGASAEIIESQVTKPLEDSLAGIEGVEVITSISRAENSQISVRFKLERAPDSAAADVRDRVSRVRNKLPDSVDEPVIAKVEADANPIIWIAFSSDKHSALEVTDFASRIVKPRLQTLPGAADVRIFGDRKFAMRIWLDRARLAAYQLTPADVEDALSAQVRRDAQAVQQVAGDHLQRIVDPGEVVGAVPFRKEREEFEQARDLSRLGGQAEGLQTPGEFMLRLRAAGVGHSRQAVRRSSQPRFFRWISSSEIAAGVTPGMRAACASVAGQAD